MKVKIIKKRKKSKEAPYTPRSDRRSNKKNTLVGVLPLMLMRGATNDDSYLIDEKVIPKKTTAFVNLNKLNLTIDTTDLRAALDERFSQIKSYRPAYLIESVSEAGSPLAVRTPTGTTLSRTEKMGVLSFFSNSSSQSSSSQTPSPENSSQSQSSSQTPLSFSDNNLFQSNS